jgi:soluble lytic murein transglycosylase-like protein
VEDGMTLKTRMRIAVLAMICTAFVSGPAAASSGPQALTPSDAMRYAAAFDAADRGDFVGAEIKASEINDKSLAGHLALHQLMHPSAHRASFQELAAWLASYADLPGAERVFALASRRKPADAPPPRQPLLAGLNWGGRVEAIAQGFTNRLSSDRGRPAREAFYAGDVKRALQLAPAAGDTWIAGLSAYRLKQYALAESYFDQVAQDQQQDAWLRAGGAYWAARSAEAAGDTARAEGHLRAAAAFPDTFYGMIAQRRTRLTDAERAAALSQAQPQGGVILAAYSGPTGALTKFIRSDPRAHRAAALAQINRPADAGLELRAGLALARTAAEREQWTALILALSGPLTTAESTVQAAARVANMIEYPAPPLEPRSGFTINKALVYAIVRQESRFNPMAVSPSGAVGLMQLMPEAAARAAGDDKLKTDMSPLFDPAFNLRVGQDYVTWLMERGVGYDILRTVAAYNGGPGTLLKTAAQLGGDADSLLVIECLPALETRNYVEKVMAGYWSYRSQFGQQSPTLDAVAKGAKFVDARLDR